MKFKIPLYAFSVGLLVIGILQTIYPEKTYMFGRSWMYKKGTEVSDMAKLFIRIAGIIIVILSVVTFANATQVKF